MFLMELISFALVTLSALAEAKPGTRYNARVVAGNPVVPDSCDTVSCESKPVSQCLLEIALEQQIKDASKDRVDIIVFPETYFSDSPAIFACGPPVPEKRLPDASSKSLCPSGGYPSTWWGKVACWAKEYHILVVVGAYEWGECLPSLNPFTHRTFPCHNNLTVFNQAMAFGVNGELLAVHHKHHLAHAMIPKRRTSTMMASGLVVNPSELELLDDDASASWPVPDAVTFTSHFGVTFGILICHELNFGSPILSLLRAGVRDVIFPTEWGGIMEGSFQGMQSGFAVAHGVNLIAANKAAGGSGIWPAGATEAPIQYPMSSASSLHPRPQWVGTLELESPVAHIATEYSIAPPPAHRLVSNVTRLTASAQAAEVSLHGTSCRLNLNSDRAGRRYLFGASNGINFAGLFESSCWLVECDVIAKQLYGLLSPSFLEQAFWPFTEDDVKFCKHMPEQASSVNRLQIRLDIESATANFFLPIGQCGDGSVPTPRPSVSPTGQVGWQTMSLSLACPLGIAAVRSFAQSEFEYPQCPEGFCPSPTLCSNRSWEVVSDARCTLVPPLQDTSEQILL